MKPRDKQSGRHDLLYYRITDSAIDYLVQQASVAFNRFTESQNEYALKEALCLMYDALNMCKKSPGTSHDIKTNLAFCYRRLASMIIRHESDEKRYMTARTMLENALAIYQQVNHGDGVLQLERQRTLHQLRKVAYELKDGLLLEKVISHLLPLAEENPITNYTADCYESLFHIAFAKGDFAGALAAIEKSVQLNNQNADDQEALELARHRVKTHLAILQTLSTSDAEKKIYFEKNIEKPFWHIYDEQKKDLASEPGSNKIKLRMQKDLVLLFSIRCQRSLLGMSWGKNPTDYVLSQAESIFGSKTNSHYLNLKTILTRKIIEIKENNFLPLDYAFFTKFPVPRIVISANAVASNQRSMLFGISPPAENADMIKPSFTKNMNSKN